MKKIILLCLVLEIVLAGRAPYLGGDMQQYIKMSEKPSMLPRSTRPATPKQLQDYRTYQSKFSDIAKAYSEGYKAAIQAVQARAVIARQRVTSARSKIPKAPAMINVNKQMSRNTIAFQNPIPNKMTVTGTERSGIPNIYTYQLQQQQQQQHNIVARSTPEQHDQGIVFHRNIPSTMLTEAQRAEISRLNAAAMHRNHYLDTVGLDSYGGHGVSLARQNWNLKKHKKRSIDNAPPLIIRHRRSRMPYLGQNLDRLGIVRVVPNWSDPPPSKKKDEVPQTQPTANYEKSIAFISKPVAASVPRSVVRQPQPTSSFENVNAVQNTNNNNNMLAQLQQQRNVIANSYTQYQQPMQASYQSPYSGLVPSLANGAGIVGESKKKNEEEMVLRSKKSASPEPDVAAMNYAARHRNVYLDGISGDAYSGGSAVLSRQYSIKKN